MTVSTSQDADHQGDKTTDGDMLTYWQASKATGNNSPIAEFAIVDLGSATSIERVVLEWADYHATDYTIDISDDGTNWTQLFSTTLGDGGQDVIEFAPATGRHIRMNSTAWSSAAWRAWLREFEIYGAGGPTPTPTNTPTVTPTPTVSPGGTMHVGDLDGISVKVGGGVWQATVYIYVDDDAGSPVAGATVAGNWSNDPTITVECADPTDATGRCSVLSDPLANGDKTITFTVEAVTRDQLTYQPADNQDPDGDSDGTTIVVSRP